MTTYALAVDLVVGGATALAAMFAAVAAWAAVRSARASERAIENSLSPTVTVTAVTSEVDIIWEPPSQFVPGQPKIVPSPWRLSNDGPGAARGVTVEFKVLTPLPSFQVHFKREPGTQSFWVMATALRLWVRPAFGGKVEDELDVPVSSLDTLVAPLTFGRPGDDVNIGFPPSINNRIVARFFLDHIFLNAFDIQESVEIAEDPILEITPLWLGRHGDRVRGETVRVQLQHVMTQVFVDDIEVLSTNSAPYRDPEIPSAEIFWSRAIIRLKLVPQLGIDSN